MIYPVYCPECGWFGMSDDCKYGRCPWCEGRVRKETEGDTAQGCATMSIKYRIIRAVIALIQRVDPYILREYVVPDGAHIHRNPRKKKVAK